MIIRRIKTEEYPFLKEMTFTALFVAPGEPDFEPEILEKPEIKNIYHDWGRKGDVAYVLEINDQLIGAAWSRLHPSSQPGYGFVNDRTPELALAIKATYRGRGYGTALLTRLTNELRWRGYPGVSLSVDQRNRAYELYLKMGFTVVTQGQNPVMLLDF